MTKTVTEGFSPPTQSEYGTAGTPRSLPERFFARLQTGSLPSGSLRLQSSFFPRAFQRLARGWRAFRVHRWRWSVQRGGHSVCSWPPCHAGLSYSAVGSRPPSSWQSVWLMGGRAEGRGVDGRMQKGINCEVLWKLEDEKLEKKKRVSFLKGTLKTIASRVAVCS